MQDLEKVKQHARDLREAEPRNPSAELGGEEYAARCLDKCRATLVGWNGSYEFGCPMDQHFFQDTGINKDAFRDFVATGATDAEVDAWIREHNRTQRR